LKKTVLIIAGPTAVGKTSVAIGVAKAFGTEIISADSRQCYREMNIGVARPTQEELAQIPHHFIASHSIHEPVTAAGFEHYALEKVRHLFLEHDVVVMTGGTGLYIKAFMEGLDPMPSVPDELRKEIQDTYQEKGLSWLQREVETLDPAFYAEAEQQNPHRLMRALELNRLTGQSVKALRTGKKKIRDFSVIQVALQIPKELLNQRIHKRVDAMMEEGLLEEVRGLVPFQHLPALQTVGYRELFDYFKGLFTLEQSITQIKTNTRQYAKRQMTWFRKDERYQWMEPDVEKVIDNFKKRGAGLWFIVFCFLFLCPT
jgi:tRNA dimethylallyltransferase